MQLTRAGVLKHKSVLQGSLSRAVTHAFAINADDGVYQGLFPIDVKGIRRSSYNTWAYFALMLEETRVLNEFSDNGYKASKNTKLRLWDNLNDKIPVSQQSLSNEPHPHKDVSLFN